MQEKIDLVINKLLDTLIIEDHSYNPLELAAFSAAIKDLTIAKASTKKTRKTKVAKAKATRKPKTAKVVKLKVKKAGRPSKRKAA